jgi:hypothetical protein
MNPITAIIALVLGILLITVWAAVHVVLNILGWILVIGAGIWLVSHFFGSNRSNAP